jgi:periplasmic protein TonB
MLETLFESGAAGGLPRAGALVSIAAHTAIIVAATVATARARPAPAPPEHVTIVPLRAVPARPATPQPPRTVASARTNGAAVPALPAPPVSVDWSKIPTGLPPMDAPPLTIGEQELHSIAPQTGSYVGSTGSPDDGGAYRAESVDALAALLPPALPPHYPEMLRRAGITGRVVVRFVVDTVGRVEPGSVTVLASAHEALERAVRDVLPRYRFRPAEAGGKRVRMLVEMPFEFALR